MSAGSDGADFAKLATEYADLRRGRTDRRYRQLLQDMDEARAMLKDPADGSFAEEELASPESRNCHRAGRPILQNWTLLPRDEADQKSAMLESPRTERACLRRICAHVTDGMRRQQGLESRNDRTAVLRNLSGVEEVAHIKAKTSLRGFKVRNPACIRVAAVAID